MYSLHYYDLVLFGVIAPILLAAGAAAVTDAQAMVVVPIAALASVAVIGYGLFIRGPVDSVEDLTEEVEDVPVLD